MAIRLLHTADIHLGAPFVHLGERAAAQRAQLRTTFQRVIDIALEREVDALLIAGDLFDSNRVDPADIAFARTQLARLAENVAKPVPALLIGGTHDCLAERAILQKDHVINDLSHVILLTPERPQHVLPGASLTVTGISNLVNKTRNSPIDSSSFPRAATSYHVGMVHGSLAIPGKHAIDDMPFTEEQMNATGLDYLALGHWHSMLDISTDRVTAWYSGSPEAIDFGETHAGHVLLVELNTDQAQPVVTPIRVGERQFVRYQVDVTGMSSVQTLLADIESRVEREATHVARSNIALELQLTGQRTESLAVAVAALHELYDQQLFQLLVKDRTVLRLSVDERNAYPERSIQGQFVRSMYDLVTTAKEGSRERAVAELAYSLGLQALRDE